MLSLKRNSAAAATACLPCNHKAGLVVVTAVLALLLSPKKGTTCTWAFQQHGTITVVPFVVASRRREGTTFCRFSSTGGGGMPPPSDDGNDRDKNNNGWGDFLNPKQESESLRRARDFMSEQSLPLSFNENDDDDDDDDAMMDGKSKKSQQNSSALVRPGGLATTARTGGGPLLDAPSPQALENNPYMQVVSKLSPSELISKFTATANPRVQDAVRNTILGLIGSLPKLAFDTTTITTGQRLASLMFQLQMTGYMFKNADYRLSLSQSLGGMGKSSRYHLLGGSDDDDEEDDDDNNEKYPVDGKVKGKLRLKYGGGVKNGRTTSSTKEEADNQNTTTATTVEMEVDAAAYMSELRSEVQQLRDELTRTQQSKADAIRKDLLLYIRTLPEQELRSLTSTMSQDVLVSMKGLVNAVMSGIGDGQITADTITEQSGEAMAQLCMWQLVVGYNLRELEVREEMKRSLLSGGSSSNQDDGVDLSAPGALE